MKPHIHCELIKLWADGAEIQRMCSRKWVDDKTPSWDELYYYRAKPTTLKYRLWICDSLNTSNGLFVQIIDDKYNEKLIESLPSFVRWHGDWQEVEV